MYVHIDAIQYNTRQETEMSGMDFRLWTSDPFEVDYRGTGKETAGHKNSKT